VPGDDARRSEVHFAERTNAEHGLVDAWTAGLGGRRRNEVNFVLMLVAYNWKRRLSLNKAG